MQISSVCRLFHGFAMQMCRIRTADVFFFNSFLNISRARVAGTHLLITPGLSICREHFSVTSGFNRVQTSVPRACFNGHCLTGGLGRGCHALR